MQVSGLQTSLLLQGIMQNKEQELLAAEGVMAMGPRSNGVITNSALPEAQAAASSSEGDQVTLGQSSNNLMSRNFFNANYTRSRYVKSGMESHQSDKAYSNVLTSVVSSLVTQASVMNMQRNFGDKSSPIENTYLIGNRLGHMADSSVGQVERKQVVDESQKNLDELQRSIEQAAANSGGETAAPEAAPVPQAPQAGAGGSPAPAVPSTPAPQAAPVATVQASSAVSAYTSGASSAPSINISV